MGYSDTVGASNGRAASYFFPEPSWDAVNAAIVCRELKIPCLIATKHATAILKTGDNVHVDTTQGFLERLSFALTGQEPSLCLRRSNGSSRFMVFAPNLLLEWTFPDTLLFYTIVLYSMANVYLTDEAYARLKAAKREDQSFSDWILENAKPRIDWGKYVGCCPDLDVDAAIAQIKKDRRKRHESLRA